MKPHDGRAATFPFALAFVAAVLAGCDLGTDPAVTAPPLTVFVANAERQDVALSMDLVGSTLGTQDVPIRARVEGFLETMDFTEGFFVKKGDLLYTIDAQPFQAKLVEAQSQLAAALTTLAKNAADLRRIKPLAEMRAVSEQDLDSAVAQEAAARAGVRASEAAVDLAEIELSYTRIIAPIDGLMGLSKAKPGEFVGREPNPVVLNTLSDIDPIRVRFSISESEYLTLSREYLRDKSRNEQRKGPENADLILILADASEHDHLGWTVASAQAIDPQTGTYSVEALFPNPNAVILPGQFARVRAPFKTLKNVIVVPRKSLFELQGRFRLYVVNAENTVEVRDVALGPAKGDIVVIESGVEAGESVIVEGLQKVRSDMVVEPKPAPPSNSAPPLMED
jgi:membrane fusion protein (multidrug efflux system)